MSPQDKQELQELRKEKEVAETARLKRNKDSAEWHRNKRIFNNYCVEYFKKNATDSDKKQLEKFLQESK